jgi:uncharacterized membrane protein
MANVNVNESIDDTDERVTRERKRPVLVAGALLGFGLGGLIDGVVFQQLLQWHHTLSSVAPPYDVATLTRNLTWDGLGALVAIAVVLAGIAVLWVAVERPGVVLSGRSFLASLGAGWCVFNIVEGLIEHQLLGLHHILYAPHGGAFDVAYLVVSGALLFVFTTIARSERPRTAGARRWWQPGHAPSPSIASSVTRPSALVTPPPRM